MAGPAEKKVIVTGEAEEDSQDDPTEESMGGKVDTINIPPLPKGKDMHFYVCYSNEDADRVWSIVYEIEERYNMKCIYADRDFMPGRTNQHNIDMGIQRSQNILLMLSPKFTSSEWCQYEMQTCILSTNYCIIPVLLEKCEVPLPLKAIAYIDATQPNCDVPSRVAHAYFSVAEKTAIVMDEAEEDYQDVPKEEALEDYKRVIRESYSLLIEDLDPQPLLDQFMQHDFLPSVTIREIRERSRKSDKNRVIVEMILSKGTSGYLNFKKFLRNCNQGHITDVIEKMERKPKPVQKQNPDPTETTELKEKVALMETKDDVATSASSLNTATQDKLYSEDIMRQEEEDFYKILSLVFDVGTEVMQNLFVSSIPPGQTIETFVDSKRHIIDELRRKRMLNAQDYDALFAVPINMARFGIPSLYLLLSKLSNIEPPLGGLNTPSHLLTDPPPWYLLEKLRTVRNVMAHTGNAKLSKSKFKMYWSETEYILVGLAGVISQAEVAAVKKKIAKIKEKKHAQVGDKTNIQMWCKQCDVKLDRGPHCNQCGRNLILRCCGYNGSSLCNEALELSSSICNICGTAVPKLNFCWSCGELVFEQDKHCSNCGKQTITLETQKIIKEHKILVMGDIVMDVGWDKAIKDKDEESIGRLLYTNKLPSPDQLRKVCEVFGKKDPLVHRICFEIGKEIQSIENDVIKVRPSYRPDSQNDVIFELYLRHARDHVVRDVLGYTVVTKVFGQYTSEGKDIADIEIKKGLHFSLDQKKQLNQCLEHYSKSLMTEHTNLQMISPSHFKSRRYGHDDPEETMCIVFYVRVKGYIPLGEKPLPDDLDGIPTDVREGGFEFLGKTTERHVNLKMGCEIAGNWTDSGGTLGPFFEYNDNLYCLTAAHVLYGLPPPGSTDHVWPLEGLDGGDVKVYQPNLKRIASIFERGHFGSVYFAKYKQGDSLNSGVDVAVIKITDKSRFPNSGKFPENDDSSTDGSLQNLRYFTGDVCEKSFLEQNNTAVQIVKFGAVTGGTRGLFHFDGTSVSCNSLVNGGRVMLYKQIEITRYIGKESFAEPGDSGSVVLVPYLGNRNDLRALGLLVGQSSTGSILATPIHAIFDELNVDPKNRRFMSFPDDDPNNVENVNSGIFPLASSTSLIEDRQIDREEPNFKEIKKEMMENKNETTAIRSEINSLKSKVDNMHTSLRSELDSLNSNINTKLDKLLKNMP